MNSGLYDLVFRLGLMASSAVALLMAAAALAEARQARKAALETDRALARFQDLVGRIVNQYDSDLEKLELRTRGAHGVGEPTDGKMHLGGPKP